ncbi:Heme oxygenase 1 [Sciurus carolinensis]|uniref:Heme oxygenase 1 n=1 Tax=Sciurus carolinensis TaxID=30640 RepID=A0AA41NH49_SCICA|nr:Heme oxygenase 1 [Sciurus carolinensis]
MPGTAATCPSAVGATEEVHTQAENAQYVRKFQKGQVTQKGFKLVMASLYLVFVALEEELERSRDNRVYARLYFPQGAVEQELTFW